MFVSACVFVCLIFLFAYLISVASCWRIRVRLCVRLRRIVHSCVGLLVCVFVYFVCVFVCVFVYAVFVRSCLFASSCTFSFACPGSFAFSLSCSLR